MSKQLVLFCDFDGTITEKDNIVAIMKRFAPDGWQEITEQILSQKIGIQEGVGKLFAMLPTSLKQDIIDFVVNEAKIRPGFGEFVQFCEEAGIKLLITSGGIDFFVYPYLAPYNLNEIYCNASDFSGENILITWPNSCDDECSNKGNCGMCKTKVIRQYDPKQYYRVVIGDSITDLAGAKIADFVIARSLLVEKCEELGLPYQPFTTFYDVIDTLKTLQAQQEEK
ncbi:2-hydroxy-3-keto-5-methylthiopentenyl-1-phosphate phosphatase [Brevibacillus dissolubilis]|uniref:2-hydroxy-3-keto-5-methylthiopentenyl-1- phosphate phosphatase n=1 Tax=Brevibacillus dissolubilis TaxID=1844116 RepID=UPI00111612D2|nr:2-hydroxy-3-keto-5-methylthiopentenyl-1-phosphate phosphatase [Brevibacillus dissolubilis]